MKEKFSGLKLISRTLIFSVCLLLLVLVAHPVSADQTEIAKYSKARKIFWQELYPDGGKSIYCDRDATRSDDFNIEHVYPASWMKEAAGCSGSNRKQCRKNSKRFNHMEADLHNLYPSRADLNQQRGNLSFAIIPGTATGSCDFEVKNKLVEPRPASRGNIARAIFYMNDEYGADIAPPSERPDGGINLESLLTYWHCTDPVDAEELRRNDVIEDLQGTRNKFIDNPSLISCSGITEFPDD